jgi:hypothetical protein
LILEDRLTISPDDLGSLLVYDLATGERPALIPLADIRAEILSTRPGAAALAFERLQTIVIRFILGWDQKRARPYQWLVPEQQKSTDAGGLLGMCRAFAIANETQARGSLHMHILLWTHGHDNIPQRIRARAALGETQKACAELVRILEAGYTSEFQFPESIIEECHRCLRKDCGGKLMAASDATIAALRKRTSALNQGPLICDRCGSSQQCNKQIATIADRHLISAGSSISLSKNDSLHLRARAQMKWDIQRNGHWPADKYGLLTGVMQSLSNTHRAEHTHTCWKKKSSAQTCRFRFPQLSHASSEVRYGMN